MTALDLAQRLGLHRSGRSFRGNCPCCGYRGALSIIDGRDGRPHPWCANGCDRDALARAVGGDLPAAAPRDGGDDTTRKERAQRRALALWAGSEPALGTIADRYLTTARELPGLARSSALRFRADCSHPSGPPHRPALIAAVVDASDNQVGIHRTYLRLDGSGKAGVEPNKASLGPIWGGAIRLDPIASEIVIGEGIETSASAGRILGLPAWAAISAGNLGRGLILPVGVCSVVIAADPDDAGRDAARAAWLRWKAEGREVRIALPDREGCDFNDILMTRGAA